MKRRPEKRRLRQQAAEFLSDAMAMVRGAHWAFKVLVGLPFLVAGFAALGTIMGTTQAYTRAWIGELPAANKVWVEREIGELRFVQAQQELYFCQTQQSVLDQRLKQAQYERSRGQRGYIDEYIRSLQETLMWNQRVIDNLLKGKAPSSQQRCK